MPVAFEQPELLYLLLILPVWGLLVWPRAGRGVLFSRGEAAHRVPKGWLARTGLLAALPNLLQVATIAFAIIGLAGPQRIAVVQEAAPLGRGIALAVDLSTSMLAEDMDGESRLDVARNAAIRFAERRTNDEMTLVGFAGQAFTRVPPTTDPALITAGVESLGVELVRNGTDISGAIVTSIARLQESQRTARVLVLLTDGAHNAAGVPPLATARAAAAKGVRIHAISMVPEGAPLPGAGAERELETETVLTAVSDITGGRYFRGASAGALDSIYAEIDRIEAGSEGFIERETREPTRLWFLVPALLLMVLTSLLQGSRWGVVP